MSPRLRGTFAMERKDIDEIILQKVRRRKVSLSEDKDLREELGLDSLDVMEIIIECEGKMGRRVANRKIHNIYKVSDIYRLIEEDD